MYLQSDCGDRKAYGYYQFDQAKNIDKLVVCANTTDMSDPDEVWEVLAHEATHTMQACAGGPVIPDKYVPRVLRELQEVAPHYYRLLNEYNGHHKRIELEAFWMELRTPDTGLTNSLNPLVTPTTKQWLLHLFSSNLATIRNPDRVFGDRKQAKGVSPFTWLH